MNDKDNISNILNAINEINTRPKKKKNESQIKEKSIPKLNQDLDIPPDVDRLILEAEKYNDSLITPLRSASIQVQPDKYDNEDVLILTEEVIEKKEGDLQKIFDLNKKIKNLEIKEVKLLLQIKNLKKNNNLAKEQQVTNNFGSSTRENLKSIHKQVEKQKELFLEFQQNSIKIERDSNVYKENYERLIVENNDLKTRLKIAKEQIVNYETNKLNLLSALNQLNEILSKSNIVAKISPQKTSSENKDVKSVTKIDSTD